MTDIDITPRDAPEPLTDAMIIDALRQTSGKLTLAAELLKYSPTRLRDRIVRTPALRQVIDEIHQLTVDVAELQLEKRVAEGDVRAIETKLKAHGKDRGYGDEVTVNVRGVGARQQLAAVMHRLSTPALAELEQALADEEGL